MMDTEQWKLLLVITITTLLTLTKIALIREPGWHRIGIKRLKEQCSSRLLEPQGLVWRIKKRRYICNRTKMQWAPLSITMVNYKIIASKKVRIFRINKVKTVVMVKGKMSKMHKKVGKETRRRNKVQKRRAENIDKLWQQMQYGAKPKSKEVTDQMYEETYTRKEELSKVEDKVNECYETLSRPSCKKLGIISPPQLLNVKKLTKLIETEIPHTSNASQVEK